MSLISLEDAREVGQVGGKAAALGSMLRAGLRVPPGFVIPAPLFEDFLDASGRRAEIEALRREVRGADPEALGHIAAQIEAWLREVPLPEALQFELRGRYAALGAGRVVVRSSAIGEDSGAASFAGQLDSFLDIEDEPSLLRDVRRCWLSFYSARALAYQRATGAPLLGMGVVVQPQVEGAVSGVAFTRSPAQPERLLIEHVEGSCEALVSGVAVPQSATVGREAREVEGATSLLSEAQLIALAETFMRLEAHFGGPQDVEWTLDPDGALHLLQSRPITTSAKGTSKGPAAASHEDEVAVFSNANINENYPDPVTPLLQSIAKTSYYHYFRSVAVAFGFAPRRVEAMEEALSGIVGVHGQRLYYDVSNIHAVMRMAPFGDTFADWFNRFVGVEATTEPRERDVTWQRGRAGRLREGLELARMAAVVTRQYTTLTSQVEVFERAVSEYAAQTTLEELRAADVPELLERVAGFMHIRTQRWTGAALADGGCMVCCGALERFLSQHFDEPGDVLLHGLLRGLPDIVSSEPPRQLWRLSRIIRADEALRALFELGTPEVLERLGWDGERLGAQLPAERPTAFAAELPASSGELQAFSGELQAFSGELQAFLDDWGFRCTGELMLTTESFQERPHAAVDMLRAYSGMAGDGPDEAIARQGALRVEQTDALARTLRLPQAKVFRALLKATGGALSLRERARLKQALLYRRFRRVVLTLSARLHEAGSLERADDALFMTWQELLALRDGAQPPMHAIASRRRDFEEQRAWPAPPARVTLPRGARWTPPELTEEVEALPQGDSLTGLAAASGKVTARATVARGQHDFHLVQAGDVLVAPQTDPGWATVLFLVRGLVMERGGMLSHGAIIAREFGIPSVVAVDRACERIPHGSTVRVDGDEGYVHILDR